VAEAHKFSDYEQLQVEKIAEAVVSEIKKERRTIWAAIIIVAGIACYGAGIRTAQVVEKLITKFLA